MHCTCCDRLLSDYESTRKSKTTGEYLDCCNKCYSTIKDVVPTIESVEHNYEEEADSCVNYNSIEEMDELYLWDERDE